MSLLRYTIGRALIVAGIRVMPPGRARSELFALLDVWTTNVRRQIEKA